jgi:nucleoside-diphosphate-sugar epimerase
VKKILIVGGTGFLGGYLLEYLSRSFKVDFTSRSSKFDFSYAIPSSKHLDFLNNHSYDFIIDNINPIALNEAEILSHQRAMKDGCAISGAKLIQISSISALPENRGLNEYNSKKAYAEQLVTETFDAGDYCILRFPGLFDKEGKARKSQGGLYYFLDQVKANKEINLVENHQKCHRNFLPIEIATHMVKTVIDSKLTGVFNAHIDSFTIGLKDLLDLIVSLNSEYDQDNIKIGKSLGAEYYIGKSSNELISKIKFRPLDFYLNQAFSHI